MLFAMANAGLPGTSGFVGEFLVIMGTMKVSFWYTFAAATTLVFGAAYTLWMYKRVIFGEVTNERVAHLKDINLREFMVLALLAIPVLWMGIHPAPFGDVLHASVEELLAQVTQSKLPAQ
jgi:NADH-quinone oxidoreductase subunit M